MAKKFLDAAGVTHLYGRIKETFETQEHASSTYLTTADAKRDYLKQLDAANTYLKQSDAEDTYLTQTVAERDYLTKDTAADTYVAQNKLGAPNGVARLDGNGLVPSSQLPSYVDDVVEFPTLSDFPRTGETGKIYVAKDTNKTYRWSGSQYTEIAKGIALGETAETAYAGDKGKAVTDGLAAHIANTSNPHNVTKENVGLGNVDNTSDLNKPISTATQAALDGKQATITGAASTVVSSKLTSGKVLISNTDGDIAVSTVSTTELGMISGATANIPTQLSELTTAVAGKQDTITGAASTITDSNLATNAVLVSDGSGKVAASGITSTELGYLDGVTSAIQGQIDDTETALTTHTGNDIVHITAAERLKWDNAASGGIVSVNYDTTDKKITYTAGATTSDVVTAAKLLTDAGGITSADLPTVSDSAQDGKYVSAVSQTNGAIAVTRASLPSFTDTEAAEGSYVSSVTETSGQISVTHAALPTVSDAAVEGKYVASVSEASGRITVTRADIPTDARTVNGHTVESDVPADAVFTDTTYVFDGAYDATSNKAATVATVTNQVTTTIQGLDGNITGTAGASKTLTALSETDGVVSATFGDISITASQVSDFDTAVESKLGDYVEKSSVKDTFITSSSDPISGKGVTAAIATLAASQTGTASKTVTALTETNGVVSATFGDIAISTSQVTDFSSQHLPNPNALTLTIGDQDSGVTTATYDGSSAITAAITAAAIGAAKDSDLMSLTNSEIDAAIAEA